jgi:hypothetical protein
MVALEPKMQLCDIKLETETEITDLKEELRKVENPIVILFF